MAETSLHHALTGRAHSVARVLWIVFALNLAVAAAKSLSGLPSASASMQADGIHSLFDSFGNIVGLVGILAASRPADKGHPYGHSKFETYGSVVIGILLLVAAFEVGSAAIAKLAAHNYTANVTPASFVVMAATLAINICVTCGERRAGKRLRSDILVADATHTLSDACVSIGVIVGLVLVKLGVAAADPIMALIVTVFIIFSAVGVFRAALRTLSDHARIQPDEIAAVAQGMGDIVEVHHVRTRGTEAEVYCDLHVLVDPEMSVGVAHALGDRFEEEVKLHFPQVKEVLVHIEPYGQDEETGGDGRDGRDAQQARDGRADQDAEAGA